MFKRLKDVILVVSLVILFYRPLLYVFNIGSNVEVVSVETRNVGDSYNGWNVYYNELQQNDKELNINGIDWKGDDVNINCNKESKVCHIKHKNITGREIKTEINYISLKTNVSEVKRIKLGKFIL